MGSRHAHYVAYKKETTWGVAVTPDIIIPLDDNGFSLEGGPEAVQGTGLYAGKLGPQRSEAIVGDETWRFSIGHQLYDHGMDFALEALIGSVSADTDEGVVTRTFTPAEPLPSYTIQHVIVDETGTARARTFAGCKMESGEAKIVVGKIVTFGAKWSAKSEVTNVAPVSLDYVDDLVPVFAGNVAITYDGSPQKFKELTLAIDNKLSYDEERDIGATTISHQQVSLEDREVTIDTMARFSDNFVWWNRVKNGTFGELEVAATIGDNSITITTPNVKPTGDPPNAPTRGKAEQPLKFVAYDHGTDPQITITTVNTDAA